MTYTYWISRNDEAIFRVGVFHSLAFHCNTLNIPWYFDRTYRNPERFRKYMVLESLNFRQNDQVDSKKHKFSRKP